MIETVYVKLLHEGSDAWRPVAAIPIGQMVFKIRDDQEVDPDEVWEFAPGSIVRCEWRVFTGDAESVPVAVSETTRT